MAKREPIPVAVGQVRSGRPERVWDTVLVEGRDPKTNLYRCVLRARRGEFWYATASEIEKGFPVLRKMNRDKFYREGPKE